MDVSNLRIQNYPCVEDTTVEFKRGVTVLIGENNSGKSYQLNALWLIFEGRGARSLYLYGNWMLNASIQQHKLPGGEDFISSASVRFKY